MVVSVGLFLYFVTSSGRPGNPDDDLMNKEKKKIIT